jgi:uncharacterized membrane protein
MGEVLANIRQSPILSGTLTPEWSFLGIELLVYIFVVVCARDALTAKGIESRDRPRWIAVMVTAFVFTFIVETLLSHSPATGPGGVPIPGQRLYTYPSDSFLVQIIGVPIWVPLGWAFILYATMRTTTMLGMKWYLAPLLDGFLALNLDMTLDPIAIHRGWWSWNVMQTPGSEHLSAYFGIPLVNFMGWYVIVASYSFFSRWFWRRTDAKNAQTSAATLSTITTLCSLPVVFIYQAIANKIMGQEQTDPGLFANGMLVATVVWVICFVVVYRQIPGMRQDHPTNRSLLAVPWVFHSYCFALLWVTRAKMPPAQGTGWLVHESSELVLFMPIAAVLGLWLYSWPYLHDLARAKPVAKTR